MYYEPLSKRWALKRNKFFFFNISLLTVGCSVLLLVISNDSQCFLSKFTSSYTWSCNKLEMILIEPDFNSISMLQPQPSALYRRNSDYDGSPPKSFLFCRWIVNTSKLVFATKSLSRRNRPTPMALPPRVDRRLPSPGWCLTYDAVMLRVRPNPCPISRHPAGDWQERQNSAERSWPRYVNWLSDKRQWPRAPCGRRLTVIEVTWI